MPVCLHYLYEHKDEGRQAVGFEAGHLYSHIYVEAISNNTLCPIKETVRTLLRAMEPRRRFDGESWLYFACKTMVDEGFDSMSSMIDPLKLCLSDYFDHKTRERMRKSWAYSDSFPVRNEGTNLDIICGLRSWDPTKRYDANEWPGNPPMKFYIDLMEPDNEYPDEDKPKAWEVMKENHIMSECNLIGTVRPGQYRQTIYGDGEEKKREEDSLVALRIYSLRLRSGALPDRETVTAS